MMDSTSESLRELDRKWRLLCRATNLSPPHLLSADDYGVELLTLAAREEDHFSSTAALPSEAIDRSPENLDHASLGRASGGSLTEMRNLLESLVSMRESGKEQGELLAELLDRVKDMGDLAAALEKKEQENDHLTSLLQELSRTRAEAISLKAKTLESYLKLQDEHSRVIRAAQLAQQVSRAQVSRSHRLKSELQDTKGELLRAQRQIAALEASNQGLRCENAQLSAQLLALERRLPVDLCRPAAVLCQLAARSPICWP